MVFMDKVAEFTEGSVTFSLSAWSANTPNSVIQQVGILGDGKDAAYDSGTALNPVWGFVFNSATPFGIDFEAMVPFLYEEGGLELAQSLVDAKGLNVKLLPVVGSPPQISGYFKHPVGAAACKGEADCKAESPIGLEGLCTANWVWRYLPPAQNVIDRACNTLVAEGIISAKYLTFVTAIAGESMLKSVQLGNITAFEFATALDDYDPRFEGVGFFPPLPTSGKVPLASQNPGHKGLRFAHSPGWQQSFFIGWAMLNKTVVWDALSSSQKVAVERAAKDAMLESYSYSKKIQCKMLKGMLKFNDGQVQLDANGDPILVEGHTVSADMKMAEWSPPALERLQLATAQHLESLKGNGAPTVDQVAYQQVITAMQAYQQKIGFVWDPKHLDVEGECGL
jgi:hypothetical protein